MCIFQRFVRSAEISHARLSSTRGLSLGTGPLGPTGRRVLDGPVVGP